MLHHKPKSALYRRFLSGNHNGGNSLARCASSLWYLELHTASIEKLIFCLESRLLLVPEERLRLVTVQ